MKTATVAISPELAARFALHRAIRAAWRTACQAGHPSASQQAAYALLRGQSIEPAFTPLRHPDKIRSASGNPHAARDAARHHAQRASIHTLAPWAVLLKGVPTDSGRYQLPTDHPVMVLLSPLEVIL